MRCPGVPQALHQLNKTDVAKRRTINARGGGASSRTKEEQESPKCPNETQPIRLTGIEEAEKGQNLVKKNRTRRREEMAQKKTRCADY